MALHWQWYDKIGTATICCSYPDKEPYTFEVSIYEGNAFAIFIRHFEEEGKEMYSLFTFMADREHAKRCLGLTGTDNNIFVSKNERLTKLRLDKNHRQTKHLVNLFTKADFDNLTIELYKEGT